MGNKNERRNSSFYRVDTERISQANNKDTLQQKDAFKVKLCLLGSSKVGKTNFLSKIFFKKFQDSYEETEGFKYYEKVIPIDKIKDSFDNNLISPNNIENNSNYFKFSVWDCGGSEIYNNFLMGSLGGFCIAILVFDVTNRDSFNKLDHYFDMVNKMNNNFNFKYQTKFLIIGNKRDYEVKDQVNINEFNDYSNKKKCDCFIINLKTENLDFIMQKLILLSFDYYKKVNGEKSNKFVSNSNNENIK